MEKEIFLREVFLKDKREIFKEAIKSPEDIYKIINELDFKDSSQERIVILCLNVDNKVGAIAEVARGGIHSSNLDPRLICQYMLLSNSVKLILVHNHPTGSLKPSKADEFLTSKIKDICHFMDFKLLDHIIVSREGEISLKTIWDKLFD